MWPPPRHQDVSSPVLLRPPDLCSGSVNALSGFDAVMSSVVCSAWKRRPGDVGLTVRMGMVVLPVRILD